LREKVGGTVTIVSVGEPEAEAAVKNAMGMGANTGILVSDPMLAGSDAFGIAYILAEAVRKIGNVDLVLTGCASGDTGEKVMAPLLAEELGFPCLSFASRIEVTGGKAVVRRIVEDGYELVESPLPLVASILSDETNVPRYAKVRDIMSVARKKIPVWTAADLDLASARIGKTAHRVTIRDVVQPTRESHCEFMPGETPVEQAEHLAERLRELKIL
jgi:electron transfer flavoprotein beta subunit